MFATEHRKSWDQLKLSDQPIRNGREIIGRALQMRLVFISMLLALAACSDGGANFPVTRDAQAYLPENVTVIPLSEATLSQHGVSGASATRTALPQGGPFEYRVGQGDILQVIVFDHPELTAPAGLNASNGLIGFEVQRDGTFFYPFAGNVQAAGRTVETIRNDLSQKLGQFITEPQIDVRVRGFNSQHVSVTGEVKEPLRQPITSIPLTLIEAVNAAGGFSEFADPSRTTIQRGGRIYGVDVEAFLTSGLVANNPVLLPGDVVTVPRRKVDEAYLLGEVSKRAAIDLSTDPVSLTQALARQGGINEVRADARGVFVFREHPGGIHVFQLDTALPTGLLLGTRFFLQPSDVIYVTRSPLQKWNDLISKITPSVVSVIRFGDASDTFDG